MSKGQSDDNLLINEQLCGNILSGCEEEIELWKSKVHSAFGSVSIFHGAGCEKMKVFVNDQHVFTLEKGQTRSITMPLLEKITVRCSEGDTFCTGKYCIDLHYENPLSPPLSDHPPVGVEQSVDHHRPVMEERSVSNHKIALLR